MLKSIVKIKKIRAVGAVLIFFELVNGSFKGRIKEVVVDGFELQFFMEL